MCDIESLRYTFQKFDKDGDGLLSVDELYNTFLSMGYQVTKDVIERSLPAGSKAINFDTFCAMSKAQTGINASQASPEEQMKQMFQKIILHFNKQKSTVFKVELIEKKGDRTIIELKNVKNNVPINAKVFGIN